MTLESPTKSLPPREANPETTATIPSEPSTIATCRAVSRIARRLLTIEAIQMAITIGTKYAWIRSAQLMRIAHFLTEPRSSRYKSSAARITKWLTSAM